MSNDFCSLVESLPNYDASIYSVIDFKWQNYSFMNFHEINLYSAQQIVVVVHFFLLSSKRTLNNDEY